MPRHRLKTKLVLAITLMVLILVGVFAYLYVYQLVNTRINEAYLDGDFVSHQIFNAARQAMEVDLSSTRVNPDDPMEVRHAVQETLETNPGINSLLQSIVGYSPIIYDAAVVDNGGEALLHTDADMQGKPMPSRPRFEQVLSSGLWHQLGIIYGKPQVYEIRLPLERGGSPFGDIRVGLSTTFLKSELRPQLDRTLWIAAMVILISMLLAAGLSHLVLRPLEAISARLDRLSAGEYEAPAGRRSRSDEYGVVSTKIDRLGRQMRDVTEVFSALKENLDQIMANLQDGLMLFTQDWRVVLVSASAEQFSGRPRSEMLGQNAEQVFSGESPLERAVLQAFLTHQPLNCVELENHEGRRVQVSMDFIEEEGEHIGALLTMRDAESVRRIESEIELSHRLAAIGRLTSGVAHEVKNPINAIVVHLEVLREKLRQLDPDARRHMDIIGSEIHRLDRVVQTLVDFTRPVELKLADTDLSRIVMEVASLAAPDAERVGVRIASVVPAPVQVKIDADLVKQALLNVVLNGIQAMPHGGTLNLRCGRADGGAQVDVADQGEGIPPEIQDRIYHLYFTTKAKGSGIGLSMTYRVMQLHNGSVTFESAAGQGTTFHLRLPLSESRQDAVEEAAARG
jgi:PAS domain S-box-containing protein